jgi:hypothetical protein
MENRFTESREAIFSASSLLVHFKNHFTESTENQFSLKNYLTELLLDSAENQL